MTFTTAPTRPGAFVQLIEYHTAHPDRVQHLIDTWAEAIGAERTTRWYITSADRDHPGTHLQLVEFPNYQAAMANSSHPATNQFADALRQICDEIAFRNLDVTASAAL